MKSQTLHTEQNKAERCDYSKAFLPANWETQGYESSEFLIAHRLGDFCGVGFLMDD